MTLGCIAGTLQASKEGEGALEDMKVPGPHSLIREEAGQEEVEGRGGRSSWTSGLTSWSGGCPHKTTEVSPRPPEDPLGLPW